MLRYPVIAYRLYQKMSPNKKTNITRSVQTVSDFFLSPTAYEQIALAKRGCLQVHSGVIAKRFKPIRRAIFSR